MSEDLEIGTVEWFKAVFLPINPTFSSNGNDETSTYYYANRAIGDSLPDGVLLTWELLLQRYTDYYNYLHTMQNGKYTRKENIIQNIEDYCYNKLYKSDYAKIQEDSCDTYLFGI